MGGGYEFARSQGKLIIGQEKSVRRSEQIDFLLFTNVGLFSFVSVAMATLCQVFKSIFWELFLAPFVIFEIFKMLFLVIDLYIFVVEVFEETEPQQCGQAERSDPRERQPVLRL